MSDTLVFVSYRRADARGDAGWLFERLRQWVPSENLFFDLDSIQAGEVLPDRIRSALDSAKVVLVVIGPDWVREINRRAELPNFDYVRAEVERALTRIAEGHKLLIVPVLVGGAAMPDRAELHADLTGSLAPLCEACAHTFTGNQQDLDNQFDRLFERIAQVTGMRRQFRLPAQYEVPSNDPPHQLSACFQDPEGCLERLCRHLDAQRRVALCGMAGVGKTHLALKYWHEHLKEYAGCWWFASETEAGLEDDALALCEKVGIPCDRQRESPAAALRRWLHPGNGKRRVYSRLFLARLLLVLESCRLHLDDLILALGPLDQWVATDHDALLAD